MDVRFIGARRRSSYKRSYNCANVLQVSRTDACFIDARRPRFSKRTYELSFVQAAAQRVAPVTFLASPVSAERTPFLPPDGC